MTAREPSHLFYQSRLRRPLVDRAEGVYIWDVDGKRYLDGSSGAMVANIGHSNARVLETMRRQMEKATFAYRLHFENEPAERLAAKTASLMPEGIDRVFFVSGGSEAVESAIKLARQYAVATGQDSRWKVISRMPSYHGSTLGALAVTGYDPLTAPFLPMMREMPKIAAPRAYLDRDNLSPHERGLKYADLLRDKILEEGAETVLAFIMEPVGGASTGALVAPDSYYGRIREICDEFGILLIYDEVMTGAGRTGRFLAAEHWGITPDLIALSKGFAAGYAPLGAMVAHNRLVEPVLDAGGFQHGYTYAGNPLACAAGLAVLEEIEREDLCGNAERMGSALKERLELLMKRFPFIGDVRGKGLLLAFELVSDRETMTPLPAAQNAYLKLVDEAYSRGLIIYSRRTRGGREGDHFMVCPPLIVTREHLDEIVDKLTDSLAALAASLGLPQEGY
ncbi:aspartate aminotransferase family protein [Stappia sp. F7233]|uniref:Aspartate aminotransferase family protein n=1 Tax=Stappia albiluteola TaxID=2758565 RepID=A0A839ADS2_9HYPH|nr:aspartate aminotransferase family protein [Stappia albiluteola]MBA5777188.1 aspartate aminotransferase family protein [Stappia albiluteola]